MFPRNSGVSVKGIDKITEKVDNWIRYQSADQKEEPRWCWGQALIGGQTARQFTLPNRKVGQRVVVVPQLCCGVEHDASLLKQFRDTGLQSHLG